MFRLFAIVPLGIGLTVIGFLWLTPFGEFHSPPLFFRIFGTFVALPFVFIGIAILKGGGSTLTDLQRRTEELAQRMPQGVSGMPQKPTASSGGYVCPSCNAPLGDGADVSPQGDVKCGHCGRWFSVHG